MSLSLIQRDFLTEMFNIGVGQAAASLAEVVGGGVHVELNVPEIEMLSAEDLARRLEGANQGRVCVVSENFAGPLDGVALLILSEQASHQLVRLLLGSAVPIERIADLEVEAFGEVGNIVLNACISSLADLLQQEIVNEIPTVFCGETRSVLPWDGYLPRGDQLIYLNVEFRLRKHNLAGYLGFSIGTEQLNHVVENVEQRVGPV